MSMAQPRANWFTLSSLTQVIAATLLLLLGLPTLQTLFTTWQHNPDYSHGWLLFPVTLWLAWKALSTTSSEPDGQSLPLGITTLLAGGMLHLAALVIHWPLIDYAGWVVLLRGFALVCWGRDAARRLLPVLAFAFLLFPLPMAWLNSLAMLLQDIIAQVAEWGLSLLWVCHRRGHQLTLAGLDEPLSVAVECSGVRQLMVFLALGWLLAFYLRGPWWRKVVLVASSIPIAILANVLRVFVLAIVARQAGTASIHGTLHDLPLLITLPLGAIAHWWCYLQLQTSELVAKARATQAKAAGCHRTPSTAAIALGVIVLLQATLQFHLSESVKTYPIDHLDFNQLPWQLGSWQGLPHPEEAKVKEQAGFADASLVRAYADHQGRAAAVYLVFSSTGQDRLHHPEICLRDAGGAVELKPDRLSIPLQAISPRHAQRFRYQRPGNQKTTVYYWHYTIMPPVVSEQSLLQRLHLKQYDQWPSVTVQVQTNMNDPAAWKAIETTLLSELDRWLSLQLPSSAQVGSSRLPVRFTGEP